MRKLIKYSCADCGWKTEIILQWADLKPKRCMGKKCKASFIKNPEKLMIEMPAMDSVEQPEGSENGRRKQRKQ